jgi:hypothetical protein
MQNIINLSSIILYLLPFIIIISAIFTITSKNPVNSVIGLISVFINSAIIIIILSMDFIGLSYLIIYVGKCLTMDSIIYYNLLFSFLPFNKPYTRALNRIGPHNLDILSIIFSSMLGDKIRYFSSGDSNRPKRLTNLERSQFILTTELKKILVGLLLGDLCAIKRNANCNTYFHFEQGGIHEEYIIHLFNIFQNYCGGVPKKADRKPDRRTGKIYTRISFVTYSLPYFNELYELFYRKGVKVIPQTIGDLLTASGFAANAYEAPSLHWAPDAVQGGSARRSRARRALRQPRFG